MVDVMTPWVSVKQEGTSLSSFLEEPAILLEVGLVIVVAKNCILCERVSCW